MEAAQSSGGMCISGRAGVETLGSLKKMMFSSPRKTGRRRKGAGAVFETDGVARRPSDFSYRTWHV